MSKPASDWERGKMRVEGWSLEQLRGYESDAKIALTQIAIATVAVAAVYLGHFMLGWF